MSVYQHLANTGFLLCVMTSLIEPRPASRDSAPVTSSPRWLRPCAPATSDDVIVLTADDTIDSSPPEMEFNVNDVIRRLTRPVEQLTRSVEHLKQKYAQHRFHEEVSRLDIEIDELGLRLDGMPKQRKATKSRGDNAEKRLKAIIRQAFEDLTAIAPFLHLAIEGEEKYELGHRYTEDYDKVLNHAEHGFYWVLCELHRLHSSTNSDRTSKRSALSPSASRLTIGGEVQNNALRHYRDYFVLSNLKRFVERFAREIKNSRRR